MMGELTALPTPSGWISRGILLREGRRRKEGRGIVGEGLGMEVYVSPPNRGERSTTGWFASSILGIRTAAG